MIRSGYRLIYFGIFAAVGTMATQAQNQTVESHRTAPLHGAPRIVSFHVGADSSTVAVVQHFTSVGSHYGAIRVPAGEGPFPIVVINHGGFDGASADLYFEVIKRVAEELAESNILVIPSYRGESIRASWDTSRRLSAGTRSPWSGDVEDALALTNAVLDLIPASLDSNIIMIGFSRGGAVALLAAARDDRISGAVAISAPTFSPSSHRQESSISSSTPDADTAYWPSLMDEMGLWVDVESPDFVTPLEVAAELPPVLLIHSEHDPVVPFEHSAILCDAVLQAGGECTLMRPTNNTHNALAMTPDTWWSIQSWISQARGEAIQKGFDSGQPVRMTRDDMREDDS